MLDLAARAALRGMGLVEPNPMVGCVLCAAGGVLAIGRHRRFGGAHAEVEALRSCAARGLSPRGATAYVTLEPCDHHGKTGPCTEALIDAGVSRVVIARRDPHPASAGGLERLRAAGVDVKELEHEPSRRLSDPFVARVRSGRPWVIAKWAQTMDGRVATRAGVSQWLSNGWSRASVHRLRSRVDAVLTGSGTVLADDPMLTARRRSVRRVARRVVVDGGLRTPPESRLAVSASEVPVIVATRAEHLDGDRAAALRAKGVEVLAPGETGPRVDLGALLLLLAARHDASNVLVEAGPGLLGALLVADLVDEAHVYSAPMLLADEQAPTCATGGAAPTLDGASRFRLLRVRRLGDDVFSIYRRDRP